MKQKLAPNYISLKNDNYHIGVQGLCREVLYKLTTDGHDEYVELKITKLIIRGGNRVHGTLCNSRAQGEHLNNSTLTNINLLYVLNIVSLAVYYMYSFCHELN